MKTRNLVLGLALLASACGGSDSNGGDAGGGITDHVCDNIPKADMQALLSATISNVQQYATTCQEDFVTVTYYTNDAQQAAYNTDANGSHTVHQLSGFGDAAYWVYYIEQGSVPTVHVRKGSSSCELLSGDGDLDDFTMVHTGTSADWHVEDSDAQAWAMLAAKACVDVLNKL